MDVRGVGSVSGPSSVRPNPAMPPAASKSAPLQATQDQLDISAAGKMLDKLHQSPDVRQERIERIKQAIADGTYDTDEKLEAALSKMLGTLGLDLDE